MSSAEVTNTEHHDEHPEYLPSLNPAPSYWPFLLSLTIGLLPLGTVIWLFNEGVGKTIGLAIAALGVAISIVPAMGWCHSVIVDKWAGHFGEAAQGRDLALGTKLFFISEIAIFGSVFAYLFVMRWDIHRSPDKVWPLDGTPLHWPVGLAAIGLLILLTSSVTCEWAHKALIKNKRGLAKDWIVVTLVLGLLFLAIQGYEWGLLIGKGFTPDVNVFATVFYAMTGFHGLHVMSGLVMLMLVYGRLEIGHYTKKRHFSMQAASWYWHLVDVVWVFVFLFIYALHEFGG